MYSIKPFLESLVEPLARELAAGAMGLRKDPTGSLLPDDVWKQRVPEARTQLGLDDHHR